MMAASIMLIYQANPISISTTTKEETYDEELVW